MSYLDEWQWRKIAVENFGCNKFWSISRQTTATILSLGCGRRLSHMAVFKANSKLRYNDKFGGKSLNHITMATKFTTNHLRKLWMSFVYESIMQLHRMLKSNTFTHSTTDIRMWKRWSIATERISYHICRSPRCNTKRMRLSISISLSLCFNLCMCTMSGVVCLCRGRGMNLHYECLNF